MSRILAVASAAALLAAQTATPALAAAKGPPANKACFYSGTIDGYTAPDEETVYVRSGVKGVWRLDLFAPCLDVDWSHAIALRHRGSSWICEGSGAVGVDVLTHSPTIGRQTCAVKAIVRLTPEEVAALPKGSRP